MVSCGPASGNQNRARTTFSGGYCGAFATTQALSWKRRNVQRVERFMTNREMVKPRRPGGPKLPEPNLPKRISVPSPEGDPLPFTDADPIDSPQPNPVINPPPKTRHLRKA